MKRFLSALIVLTLAACASAQTITAAEYFVGNTDPGEGLATAITVSSPADNVALNWSVATGSLNPHTLYRVNTRVRTDGGVWGRPHAGYIATSLNNGIARLITSIDYSVDGGSFTTIDVPDGASTNLNDAVSTVGMTNGVHRLHVRSTDNSGRTGIVNDGFFVIVNTAGFSPRSITQMEYSIDGGSFTSVDVVDGATVNMNEVVSTTGITNGVHRLHVRSIDDAGRTGIVNDGFFVVSNSAGFSPRAVTNIEYWYDSDPPTNVDVPDNGIVNWSDMVPTAGLSIGLHAFNVRAIDDLGRVGATNRSFLIVTSPFEPGQAREFIAAEYWVNVDPGEGNGVNIPLPQDGVWDEGEEVADFTISTLPIGKHQLGVRLQDNAGRWSKSVLDTIIVGPILTTWAPGGNDIVLNWESGTGADEFYIYRKFLYAGAFTKIDSTTGLSYTDVGVAALNEKAWYQVTFNTDNFSTYRLPEMVPARE